MNAADPRRGTGIRRAALLGLILISVQLADCRGNSGLPTSLQPDFLCSGSGLAPPNSVTLRCETLTSNYENGIEIELEGPTSGATALRGLTLDIVWNPEKIHFRDDVPYVSPLMPGAFVGVQLVQGRQGRVTISVVQPGGAPDVRVGPGRSTVLTLHFTRVVTREFDPVAFEMQNATAIDASAPIQFGPGLIMWGEY